MRTVGVKAPDANSVKHAFLVGKTKSFDPDKPDEYLKSFAIKRA